MKRLPKVGDHANISFIVTDQHIIDFADAELPPVLCTPWLIWFLEHAAREAVLPLLDADESTVGSRIDVEHIAATPPGQSVTCTARVIHTDGPVISFQLEAHDPHEKIARGTHKLCIIKKHRFAKRVNEKSDR